MQKRMLVIARLAVQALVQDWHVRVVRGEVDPVHLVQLTLGESDLAEGGHRRSHRDGRVRRRR